MQISRLQLAAALMEYDNDQDDPSKPWINAADSVLFAPFRQQTQKTRPPPPRLSSTYITPARAGFAPTQFPLRNDPASPRSAPLSPVHHPILSRSSSADWGSYRRDKRLSLGSAAHVDLLETGINDGYVRDPMRDAQVMATSLSPSQPANPLPRFTDKAPRLSLDFERRESTSSMTGSTSMYARRLGHARHSSSDVLEDQEREEILKTNDPEIVSTTVDSRGQFGPQASGGPRGSLDSIRPGSRVWPTSRLRRSSSALSPLDYGKEEVQDASDTESLRNSIFSALNERGISPIPIGPEPAAIDPLTSRPPSLLGPQMSSYDQSFGDIFRPLPQPSQQDYYRGDRLSRIRPKTLFLPRPLSTATPLEATPPNIPECFTLGDRPLPPSSRTPVSAFGIPGIALSLSQKTFRDSLAVEGVRDKEFIGGADVEGEIGVSAVGGEEEDLEPLGPVDRRPGLLFGRSLMDELETRKAFMKSKQRVFMGDSRPSMMARGRSEGSLHRHSSLSVNTAVTTPGLPESVHEVEARGRMAKSQSVFGVDIVWEREMAKLRSMQEAQARVEAQHAAQDALEGKKKKRQSKSRLQPVVTKGSAEDSLLKRPHDGKEVLGVVNQEFHKLVRVSPIKHLPSSPPRLSFSPVKSSVPHLPVLIEDMPRVRSESAVGKGNWSESDDEDETIVGKIKNKGKAKEMKSEESDPEEDLPLSQLPISKGSRAKHRENDSDEDVPLSNLKVPSRSFPAISPTLELSFGELGSGSLGLVVSDPPQETVKSAIEQPRLSPATKDRDGEEEEEEEEEGEEEDDDVPLGLRRSFKNGDDDVPLGLKHAAAVQRLSTASSPGAMAMPPYGVTGGQWSYSDPNLVGAWMYGMGYAAAMGTQAGHSAGMMKTGEGLDRTGPLHPQASQRVDDWRQEVAIAPAAAGSS